MTGLFSDLPLGTKLWLGQCVYVATADGYAALKGDETMSRAIYRAWDHPKKRMFVIISWSITTKHLFFPNFLRKCDPFFGIGLLATRAFKLIRR